MITSVAQLRDLYEQIKARSDRTSPETIRLRRKYNELLRKAKDQPVHLPDIHPNLWLSGADAARRMQGSQKDATRVCVASEQTCGYCVGDRCKEVRAYDTPDQSPGEVRSFLDEASRAISSSLRRGATVVHCKQGINRSVASIVEYAKRFRGMDPQSTIRYIRDRNVSFRGRPAMTNILFEQVLMES